MDRTGQLRRRITRGAAVLLPLVLAASVGGQAATTVTAPHRFGPAGWFGLWQGATTGATTGTTLKDVRTAVGAGSGTAATLTGAGVGVALIDTGVAPVAGLPAAQIVNGPDLSFESQAPGLRYLDTYGHGTHLAGIIVGRDTATGTVGLAPKAKLTSIKMGTANGAVDITQMIAAVDWVVAHRNDDPTHPIRVINLSYGSVGDSSFWDDPLAYAVERAWAAGIVVVVAAGNGGYNPGLLPNPASDQYVLTVGSVNLNGTPGVPGDDTMSTFSETSWDRNADLLALGESIVSLADPGSNIDQSFPAARVGSTLFRGSGTSQSAAVTSAVVALLLQHRPGLTPDQVKGLLKATGTPVTLGPWKDMNLSQLNLPAALTGATNAIASQRWKQSTGAATLDSARGSSRVVNGDVALSGQASVWGPLDLAAWRQRSAAKTAWAGGVWMGHRVAGDGWTGKSWASRTWAPATWTGKPWGGATTWTDPDWSGRYWSGRYWSGRYWSGRYWSSDDWSAAYWG